jgi:hypothetical protein
MCSYTVKVALHFQILANSNRVKPVKMTSKLSKMGQGLQCEGYRDITRSRHRETLIAKLTEVQHAVEQLLAELQASERDKFAAYGWLPPPFVKRRG